MSQREHHSLMIVVMGAAMVIQYHQMTGKTYPPAQQILDSWFFEIPDSDPQAQGFISGLIELGYLGYKRRFFIFNELVRLK